MTVRTSRSTGPSRSAPRAQLHCAECGWQASKWVGRCPECGAWSSLVEAAARAVSGARPLVAGGGPAVPIGQVDLAAAAARPTGVSELDRVLGGGLVPGAVLLLAGEPGVGKSTLLLEVGHRVAAQGRRTLYITGEESAPQVRLRAERVGALSDDLLLAAENDLGAVVAHVDTVAPSLLVVDSVQTIASSEVDNAAGGVGQVREVAACLIALAKARGMATILVGHVTKDGSIAGPRVLEHLVDVVLQFEGERSGRLRTLRAVKNRFGPSDELGCFDLRETGIVGLADPTGLFLSRHEQPVPGTCVTVGLEGRRPLLAEVQALAVPSASPVPRRATSGIDSARAEMVLAVLARRAGVAVSKSDVYLATVGGARLTEPSADLALALAVAGSVTDVPLPADTVAFGEVGLAGEVRRIPGLSRRVAEAARIGLRRAVVPAGEDVAAPPGFSLHPVADVQSALAFLNSGRRRA